MKEKKSTTRNTAARERVVRTTVGDLIATLVETVGFERACDLLASRSPLQRVLHQQLVVA